MIDWTATARQPVWYSAKNNVKGQEIHPESNMSRGVVSCKSAIQTMGGYIYIYFRYTCIMMHVYMIHVYTYTFERVNFRYTGADIGMISRYDLKCIRVRRAND